MSKNIFYRIAYDYDEANVPRLTGIAKSQIQKLLVNTDYDKLVLKDTSFMMVDDGTEDVLFVVKHSLVKGFESVYCYTVYGMDIMGVMNNFEIPLFFSRTNSQKAISVSKLDESYDVSDIEVVLDNEDNCNYMFFI